ncbi:LuxR C-terminal-related transcriptional regulator [Micromonospora arborensis]|uniref:LuxR C-terminal-related transcriptional regulator n=1 Tax=Micromonospora arborensis TaxID=2116518 RepID=UPI00142E7482|nr:response regulator transcription factor [Micromonospora arborensis]
MSDKPISAGDTATRLLLVDDRTLVRVGVRILLEQVPGFEVIGEASDAREAIRKTSTLTPDVVIIDALAHRVDAAEVTQRLLSSPLRQPPRILILVNAEDEGRKALQAGAAGVLRKHATADEFVSAIRIIAAGYLVLAPQTRYPAHAATIVEHTVADPQMQGALTPREMDVLKLIARGATNAEISRELSLRESTVKSHVQHLLTKLNLRSRVHAVIYAFHTGLIQTRSIELERR